LIGLQVRSHLREAPPPLATSLIDALKALAELLARKPLLAAAARGASEASGR
jgi:hypothetical protein